MGNKIKAFMKKHRAAGGRFAALTCAAMMMAAVSTNSFSAVGTVDYDALIADQEAKIQQLQKDNDKRKQQINSYNGSISENEEIMGVISDQIDGVNSEILAYGEKITIKQNEIADKRIEIANIEQDIADKEDEIEKKGIEIEKLRVENNLNLERFAKLARALYMYDPSDTLPLFSGDVDWYNVFVYSDVVENISGQNFDFMNQLLDDIHEQEQMIEELDREISDLEKQKSDLETEKTELEAKITELEGEKSELETYKDSQYNDLYALAAENQTLSDKVSSLRYKVDATNEEIEQANKDIEEIIRQKQAANSGQTVYSSDGFRWPLDANFTYLTTYFGYDSWRGGNHYGIDVGNAGIGGQNIYAAQSGTVITAYNDGGWHGGYGNYVVIDHGGGLSTLYAHCVSTAVSEGQVVNKGDVIGYVGQTGWATGNHLHFEVRVNGVATDPMGYGYEYIY